VTAFESFDWEAAECDLDQGGHALLPDLLDPGACADLVAMYADDQRFRKHVVMAEHRFGQGDYKYFAHPLPPVVAALRERAYPPLAAIANRWSRRLRSRTRYPATLAGLLRRAARAGQARPTPLLLRYEAGGYNCLHQDLYGEVAFPLQIAIGLSRPDQDYQGGEFLLVEQRPRAQSIGRAIRLGQGEGVVFPNRLRPVAGKRFDRAVSVRHGVSPLRSGTRLTLGIIFHDAR
jgi:hypothetical protein